MPKVLTPDNRIKEISDYIANDKQSMLHLGYKIIEENCSKNCECEETECAKEEAELSDIGIKRIEPATELNDAPATFAEQETVKPKAKAKRAKPKSK